MKKTFLFLIVCISLAGLILATGNKDGNSVIEERVQAKIKVGEILEFGNKTLQIKEGIQNKIRLQTGEVLAGCGKTCNLTQERIQNQTKLMAKLSNGKTSEIKIMPDTASERALERLRLKVCSEEKNCSIELKEVGSGEKTRMAYELQTERDSKVFGLFKSKMQVQAQVDAENGEIIQTKKPWWAFFASEPEETE